MKRDEPSTPPLPATELVRRMGHDFNNLFSVVLGGLSLLREELDPSAWNDGAQEVYDDVASAAREAADVIAMLTAWSARQALEPQPTDLDALLAEVAPALRQRLPATVTLERVAAPHPVRALVDREHCRRAVGELVSNAADAVIGTGTIRVEAGGVDAPWISVIDTGAGMDRERLEHCREPYFTTRRDQGRRGLGLSVVDGFARASGGALVLLSTLGDGTRAMLELPPERPAPGRR